ncbi:MAG: response regulator [Spirochaetales bacterium]|nr:response regulator [Spirochaetales bacterium]
MSDRIYKLMIVDDEAIIREGITRKISWGENGFELAGTFEHGLAALEYIHDNPVDVVISDINMPRMDGLELSRELARNYPHITVLLLTGYDDFEYAKEAVRNQVREFLLKPITAKELQEVLARIRAELEKVSEKNREDEEMKKRLEESFPLLRERFLNRLVGGKLTEEIIEKRSHYLGWKNLQKCYQLLAISIPLSWDTIHIISLSEFLKSIIAPEDEVFTDREDNLLILLQGREIEPLNIRSRRIAEEAFLRVFDYEKEQISVGCGEIVEHLDQLPGSYRGAFNAMEYSRVMGISQILSAAELSNREKITLGEFNELTRNLISSLTEGNREDTQNALEAIFTCLKAHYLSGQELPFYFARLHYLLYYFVEELDLYTAGEPFFPQAGEKFGSLTEAKTLFTTILNTIDEKIHSRRHDMVISRMDRARKIISEEYQDSKFSLQDICNKLYLSVSQFSLIFKEGTGQTFIEYLTSYRVEEAKKLLKTTDLKGYQIAEAVGYTDPRYFSLIFKKHTGMTAMEYRKSLES